MANKPTKRERRDLAKKQRVEQQRVQKRRRRARIIKSAIALVVIGALVAVLISMNKGKDAKLVKSVETAATAVGCGAVQTPPDEGHDHIVAPTLGKYSSNPPTSGQHYNGGAPQGPYFTGVSSTPIQNELQVHNLEHGHVGIQYNKDKLKPDVLAKLQAFTKAHDTWVFLAPRDVVSLPDPGYKDTLTFTAWRKMVSCGDGLKDDPAGVEALATKFYDTYKDKSPYESVVGSANPAG